MTLNTYLNFNGNCEAAFRFYEQHLGGKITAMMTHSQSPTPGNTPPEWGSKILYASLALGGSDLMGSDVPKADFGPMRSSYLSLNVDTPEEAERIFPILTEGGQVYMPMQETFWALRFGICRDSFGVLWMINAPRPMPTAP
jgi:PhnB protein